MAESMTVEEVLESQKKIRSLFNCPKCKDKRIFKNLEGFHGPCMEC